MTEPSSDIMAAIPKDNESKNEESLNANSNQPDAATSAINASLPSSSVVDKSAAAQTAEARRIGSFPGDLSNIKPIFSLKSKNT